LSSASSSQSSSSSAKFGSTDHGGIPYHVGNIHNGPATNGTADVGLDASPSLSFKKKITDLRQSTWFQTSTVIGAIMFVLYHVVFCLAMGSAIQRPSSPRSILGIMAKMSAVGVLASGPLFIFRLGKDIPVLYSSIDLFMAPFLAHAAIVIDNALVEKYKMENGGDGDDGTTSYPDSQFFATFAVLTGIGLIWASMLLRLAASFRLANLGTFLPYPVLCGFFSAVGVLLWALAFSVDTSGLTWQHVFLKSNDTSLMINSFMHHLPSLFIGIMMNRLGPKSPFSVVFLLLATQAVFYLVMWATGTTLQEAQAAGWFWSEEQLVYQTDTPIGFSSWYAPPAPFGGISVLFQHDLVCWSAIRQGLHPIASLAVLYLLRSSIHASALKKNVGNLVRRVPVEQDAPAPSAETNGGNSTDAGGSGDNDDDTVTSTTDFPSLQVASDVVESIQLGYQQVSMSLSTEQELLAAAVVEVPSPRAKRRSRLMSDAAGEIDVEFSGPLSAATKQSPTPDGETHDYGYIEVRPSMPRHSLEDIFVEYSYCLSAVALAGGFACCPTMATSHTMYAIGADGYAPQIGSVLLLAFVYLTDFSLVEYIPKAAFSSLLVLGAVDTFVVWFIRSFKKTQDMWEWSVNPIIVLFSLIVGFLNAVFLGVAISTFVFVGAFFKVGTVKFAATAQQVRSSIERPLPSSEWLDSHGDFIQVLVLQNYLFFGNANNLFNYISTMFEDVEGVGEDGNDYVTPKPKVLIIDLSLISGMDTSSVDTLGQIRGVCKHNECKLFLCGLSPTLRKGFSLVGLKPETNVPRGQRLLRYFADFDTALGKAEDFLLKSENVEEDLVSPHAANALPTIGEREPLPSGFRTALLQIDQQHDQHFAKGLIDLEQYTQIIDLEPEEVLLKGRDTRASTFKTRKLGLYFIEYGFLKIEKNTSNTLTRSRSSLSLSRRQSSSDTQIPEFAAGGTTPSILSDFHARTDMLGQQGIVAKLGARLQNSRNFRVARIGPGWYVLRQCIDKHAGTAL